MNAGVADSTVANSGTAKARQPFNQLVDSKYGPMLVNRNDRYVGRSLALYGEYCEGELALFRQICKAGDTVVEVGANIGAHTLPLARYVGEAGHVHAFEPQRLVFQTLCANMALNSIGNVTCYPYGVAAEAGTIVVADVDPQRDCNFGGVSLASIDVSEAGALRTQNQQQTRLQLVRLDDAIGDRPVKLLKIDVEGMESQVIDGAAALIRAQCPILYVENDRRDKSQALIEQLWSLDYELYWSFAALFNADNFRKNENNIFGNIVSVNMLCVPKLAALTVVRFEKVEDSQFHPMGRAGK